MRKQIHIELLEILKKEKELLNDALNITKNITSLLASESSIEELSAKIQSRQEIIVKIDELDRSFSKIRQQVPEEDFKKQLDIIELKNAIRELLQSIIHEDADNKSIAEEKLRVCSEQIRNLQKTKKGINSYANPYKSEDGVYIDAKK